jgi:ABC-type transport system substrate-binding protein
VDNKAVLHYAFDFTPQGGFPYAVDPALVGGSPANNAWMNLLYDNLVRHNADGASLPGLATAWSFPDDHTIELTLRRGVTFQDGSAFDATAVKAGIERNLRAFNPTWSPVFQQLDSIDVIDDHQLRFRLKSPSDYAFFQLFSSHETSIVSPTAVRQERGGFAQHPVGAGPYRLDNFEADRLVSVRKYANHWEKGSWKLAGIDFVATSTGAASVGALLAGTIDMIPAADASTYDALRGKPDIKLFAVAAQTSPVYFGMCTSVPPFDELKVRQAVAYAIDRDAVTKATVGTQGTPTDLPWTRKSAFYATDVGGRYPFNPNKARALLKAAGLPQGFSFDLITLNFAQFETPAEVIQQQLARVGIKMHILTSTNIVQDLQIDKKAPATVLTSVSTGPDKLHNVTNEGGLANWCHYDNAKLNAAVHDLKASPLSVSEQQAKWRIIEQALMDDVPIVYLFSTTNALAYATRVAGVKQLYPSGAGPDFRTVYIRAGG